MRYIQPLLMLAISCAPCAAFAVTATATATVVERLTITNTQPLSFGFIAPAGGGSVTVTAGGQRQVGGGVDVQGNDFHHAAFDVQGTPGKIYTIHLPASQLFVAPIGSADPAFASELLVHNFVTSSVNQGSGTAGKLDNSGQDTVYLGGTIEVPANAVPGVYSGVVPLTVSY